MTWRNLVLLVALLVPAVAAGGAPPYLAKVNDETITAADLKDAFVRRHGGHQKFLAGETEIRKMLDILIDQRLLVQEAYQLGLDQKPEIVEASKRFEDRKAIEYLIRTEIEGKAKPSGEEVRAAWEKYTGEVLDVRLVAVERRPDAEGLRSQLLLSGDFDRMARECSTAPSRVYGGLVRSVGWGTMERGWEDRVLPLSPGEVAPVVRGKEGWEVVRVESRTPVARPAYEQARGKIEAILKRRKAEERKNSFADELWARYHAKRLGFDLTPAEVSSAIKATPDKPVAAWDGGTLPLKEFAAGLDLKSLAALLPEEVSGQLDHVLWESVNEKLVLLEAQARQTGKVPEVATAVTRYREDLMEGALYDGFILKGLKVSDEDVKAWYDGHRKELVVPEKRRVAHIVTAECPEAAALKKRLDAGERFEDLVKAHSKDKESAKSGGDLGLIEKKQTPKEFEAVLALREGDVSGPIPSKFGCHLIKVTKIVPERPMEFTEAKGDIRKKLIQDKQKEMRAVWVKKLRAASTIGINDAEVRAFAKEASLP